MAVTIPAPDLAGLGLTSMAGTFSNNMNHVGNVNTTSMIPAPDIATLGGGVTPSPIGYSV